MEKKIGTESSMASALLEMDERKLIVIRSRYNRAVHHLKKYGGKSVLDIGCSVGYGSHILHSAGFRVKGIDYNRKSIKVAKKEYPWGDFRVADATSLNNGKYDAVVALEVVEHLKDYRTALKNWIAMLNPGGIMIISTPNARYSKGDNKFHHKEFEYNELKVLLPESDIEGFDFHYITTKPITVLFGGVMALKFRMGLNKVVKHFPKYCNTFVVVVRKRLGESLEKPS